ncbi:MAG: hypothetical protein PHT94_04885 [Candidatus Nanoarchaeia archaeon]|nr:hypothetical protein [Candidatus Nanoarchaeia archaeon]
MSQYESMIKSQKKALEYLNNVGDTSAFYLDKARIESLEASGVISEDGLLDYKKLKNTDTISKFVEDYNTRLSSYAKKILEIKDGEESGELNPTMKLLKEGIITKGVFGIDKNQLSEVISQSPELVGNEFYRLQSTTKRIYSEFESSLTTPYDENKGYISEKFGDIVDTSALSEVKLQEILNSILKGGLSGIKQVSGIDHAIKDKDKLEDLLLK